MEAHLFLAKRGFRVESFGSGNSVKLPGPAADRPNVYDFDSTTYEEIYSDLKNKDIHLYTQNGLLNMVDRNRRIKSCPQKFQRCKEKFDVIICLEERVYDQVVEDLQTRESTTGDSVHVINFDIQDNHEEATLGALFVVELCKKLEDCEDLDNEIDEVLAEFEANNPERNILHTICFY
ncbi:ssu72-like protein domain-containing protein [Ditylenchus destructor]|uniref:RNA polymerase II subunit A C-terminal domain phosphatase SSU72 n=1 Tax=Ditylenchus destructor TaxID=166010 RepID=A0AAD4NCF5_9BILA|nr:ssu72-like protein domain-containing protein [Ditylenchus destructor]